MISLDYVASSGSILVWKAKGLKRYNIALGFTPSLKQSLENGQITRSISQNEQNWGEAIIHTLESIAKGNRVEEYINMKVAVIGEP